MVFSVGEELVEVAAGCVPDPVREAVRADNALSLGRGVTELTAVLVADQARVPLIPVSSAKRGDAAAVCDVCPQRALCGGHPDGCRWDRCSRSCGRCPVRCPDREDLAAWFGDVGQLDLGDLVARFEVAPALPAVVPVVEASILVDAGLELAEGWPAWGVSIGRVHSVRTGRVWPAWADGGLAAALRAAGARLLVLEGVATDGRLAKAWPSLRAGRTADGVDVIVAPAWSVYDDDPRMEHLFAIRQSAVAATKISRSNRAAVVPTLHWQTRHDLDRQLAWVERGGGLAVGVDASTLHSAAGWLEVRAALAYVVASMPDVVLHVSGPATAGRLEDLAELRGRVVVHSGRPAALARAHRYLDERLVEQARPDGMSLAECLLRSVEAMDARLRCGRR